MASRQLPWAWVTAPICLPASPLGPFGPLSTHAAWASFGNPKTPCYSLLTTTQWLPATLRTNPKSLPCPVRLPVCLFPMSLVLASSSVSPTLLGAFALAVGTAWNAFPWTWAQLAPPQLLEPSSHVSSEWLLLTTPL